MQVDSCNNIEQENITSSTNKVDSNPEQTELTLQVDASNKQSDLRITPKDVESSKADSNSGFVQEEVETHGSSESQANANANCINIDTNLSENTRTTSVPSININGAVKCNERDTEIKSSHAKPNNIKNPASSDLTVTVQNQSKEEQSNQKHAWNIDVNDDIALNSLSSSDKSLNGSSSTLKLAGSAGLLLSDKSLNGYSSTLNMSDSLKNYVPARLNSPFFLKQLDISNEIVKTDPNVQSDMTVTSIDNVQKKTSIKKKTQGFSLISNSESESYSRSSSANDSSTSNVRVAVRVRPLCSNEKQRGDKQIIEYPGKGSIWVDIGSNSTKPFTFNTIFDDRAGQQQVFEECGIRDLVDKALDGFSCTAFAFGQTGSGKTHTITGPANQNTELDIASAGLVPRCFQYLYETISKSSTVTYTIKASFLEVYNEKVKDLLNPSNAYDSLIVRWSSKKGFYVDNLFVMECESLDDLMSVLIEGSMYRQVGVHAVNDHSSRSHSILTVYVDSAEELDSDDEAAFPIVRNGKISFVDLAGNGSSWKKVHLIEDYYEVISFRRQLHLSYKGSERVKETKSTGESLMESHNINKSLLTLGNCISALGDPKKRGNHIPYRESKLTKLLADSLGGDGFTLMIACISPSSHVLQDTMNTLRYANRAKNIKNKPIVKMDPKEQLLQRVKREMKLLKAENIYFRQQLGVPYSESQIIITPNQIEGELTENESGTLSPAIGSETLSSIQSSRNNSCKEFSLKDFEPRATTALCALGAKNGLYDMLQEYMNENESLKTENMQLHRSRAVAQRQQEEMFRENERLTRKLDDLGRVMLSTPLSREHVKSWISADSPGLGIFSRQATADNRIVSEHSSVRGKQEEGVRFPPVQHGSYPNYVNSVDLSAEVEHEKQKVYEKKERERLAAEKKAIVNTSRHASSQDSPTKETIGKSQLSYRRENGIRKEVDSEESGRTHGDDDVEFTVNENARTTAKSIPRSSSMKTKESIKTRKNTQPKAWRMKKKPPTVEKPSSYAAKFAARKELLSKQISQRQPSVQQSTDAGTMSRQLQQRQMTNPIYAQQPMYAAYNGGYMQYPYMDMGMMTMPQGIHQGMPMTAYNGVNNTTPPNDISAMNGHARSEMTQLKQPKHTNKRNGR